jgi:predicted DNA-binding protein with PD1-like motif
MRTKLLHEFDGLRTFAVVLDTGDEAIACLEAFARDNAISGAQITAIGAFRTARLAYFDWASKAYQPIPVEEQVEVASLVGDIAIGQGGAPSIHAHAVLGRRDGSALAGHLQNGDVRPTLEIIVTESPTHLCKVRNFETGLALIKL